MRDLETTNLSQRLNRSAAEIRYGRARDAAPREGLIADALEGLERDLHETARVAAREASGRQENPGPQELLAELGDMRRALRSKPSEAIRDAAMNPMVKRVKQRAAVNSAARRAAAVSITGIAARASAQRTERRDQSCFPGSRKRRRLRSASIPWRTRATGLELSPAEINTLRRMSREARKLSGDALASQLAAVSQLVDRLELAALAAVEQSRDAPSPTHRASTPDAPQYRGKWLRSTTAVSVGIARRTRARAC